MLAGGFHGLICFLHALAELADLRCVGIACPSVLVARDGRGTVVPAEVYPVSRGLMFEPCLRLVRVESLPQAGKLVLDQGIHG